MKLWGTCLGDRVGQPRHIFQGLLHIGNKAGPREIYVVGSEAGEAELFKLFKTKVWEWIWNYRIWCLPCMVLVLPLSILFSLCPHCPFWKRNVFSVPQIVGAILCFCFSGVMDKRLPWVLEETLDVWRVLRLLESMVTSEVGPNAFCIMRLALSL